MITVNGQEVNYSLFDNNELKIEPILKEQRNYLNKDLVITINLYYENSIDISLLIFVKKYLDEYFPLAKKVLTMLYIPYERMDRETKNQMFTAKYFAQFINSLKFDIVCVLDPHSNVVVGAINNIYVETALEEVKKVIEKEENNIDAIFLPDVGAYKKYNEVLEEIDLPKFWGNKHRDLNDGKITDYQIIGDIDVKDKNILIVDDLCVKGYTTLFAAKKLKELGAKKVIFYCSHCEDSIFKGELLKTDFVDHIYTTNSIKRDEDKKITNL